MEDTDTSLDTLYGRLQIPDWPDDLIIRSLKELGEWCAIEPILAASLLEPGETLWDGGAFLGTFALGVAAASRPAHVVAIEANPLLGPALTHNLALLPCPSDLVAKGLGARPCWLVPVDEDASNHGATAYRQSDEVPGTGPAIACETLPGLRARLGDYDVLKLDLEGMELEALRADFAFLRARKPVIWAECNESRDSLDLLGALKWLNYDVLYVAFPAFRKANHRGSADLIFPMAYEAALVAGPADRLNRLAEQASDLAPGEEILLRRIDTAYDLRRALFDTPRWARREWATMTRAELIAQLVRCRNGVKIETFLVSTATTDT